MKLPSPTNVPGNAIAQFGQDLMRFGEIRLRRQNALDQARYDAEISLAYTYTQESLARKLREFQDTGDKIDSAGRPYYMGFGEHWSYYRDELWKDIEKQFSSPEAAEQFFPTYNEMMSQKQIELDNMAYSLDRQRTKNVFAQAVDKAASMPGVPPDQRKADVAAGIQKMIEDGFLSLEEAEQLKGERFHQIDYNGAAETAGDLFSTHGFDAARSYILKAEGITEDDRDKLLNRFSDEYKYQTQRDEEAKKERGNRQYRSLAEEISEGKINSVENFHDLVREYGQDLSETQYDKLRNMIKGNEASKEYPNLKSDPAAMNDLYLGKIRGDDIEELENKAYYLSNPDNFENGVPRITAKDAQEFIQETRKDVQWHSSVTDELATDIREMAAGKDAILTNAEAEQMISDMLQFANSLVPQGQARTPEAPRVDESLIRDWKKAKVSERLDKKVAREGLRSMLGWFKDSLFMGDTEKVLEEAEAGLYTGIINEEVVRPYFRMPELPDYNTMRDQISQAGWNRRYEALPEREKNEATSNANMVMVLHNLQDAARKELGVTSPALALTNRGEPLIIDTEKNITYTARTVNKDEKWFRWDGRLADFVPLESE